GGRGFGAHGGAIDSLKNQGMNIDVVAVSDAYRPRMQKAMDRFDAKGYMDYRELIADPNVDIVTIATPDHQHGYQAIDAVKAGKDVYCEKPVTHWRQFELTKQLAQEVKKSGQVFQLGTQGMSDGAWHLMKKLVQDGQIGQPIHAECGYFRVGDWGERGMKIDDPNAQAGPDLDWKAFLGDSPKKSYDVSRFFRWRMYEDYAGGPVTDLFPHSFTPVLSILGVSFPSKVVATGGKFRYQEREIPDTFNMLIDYPEKITVAVLGTQGNNYAGTGSRGAGSRIPIIRGWEGTLTVEGEEVVFTPAEGSDKKPQRFPIEHGEDWHGYWKVFIECCRQRNTETLSTAETAYHVQTALQMGMIGFREEEVAKFNPVEEEIVL
ncbi:MAG: Gfo/Idh/MocA family oxidoreductase, partial [Candidatus Omnitrophica bacterium]|nr:Gfo/Idh/MocA family oxidoreductase [Candidatus Omnitrophota bacterium]